MPSKVTVSTVYSAAVEPIGLDAATDAQPLLQRAYANQKSAHHTKPTWEVDGPDGKVEWFNHTQIFRTPFMVSAMQMATRPYAGQRWEEAKREQLGKHLDEIEQTLNAGMLGTQTRYHIDEETGRLYSYEYKTMGGVWFYLRRDPTPDDQISLLVLRDCIYRDLTTPDLDGRKGEYLSEISLEVIPAT